MNDDSIEAQYNITKVSRLSKIKKFYEGNKILVFLIVFVILMSVGFYTFYNNIKENKKIELSQKYIQAKIFIENDKKDKATNILKEIIYSNNPVYSTLSLFLIINENLITDNKNELVNLFEHILKKNKFDIEIRNLIIYKKCVLISDYATESEMLESTKILLKDENLLKPHALMLLGDYFVSKKEYLKAQEFYAKIISNNSYSKNLYDQANLKLTNLQNE